jgi:hypothetical protein
MQARILCLIPLVATAILATPIFGRGGNKDNTPRTPEPAQADEPRPGETRAEELSRLAKAKLKEEEAAGIQPRTGIEKAVKSRYEIQASRKHGRSPDGGKTPGNGGRVPPKNVPKGMEEKFMPEIGEFRLVL